MTFTEKLNLMKEIEAANKKHVEEWKERMAKPMYKEHTWHKVFHTFIAYDGKTYTTFVYAMGNDQIKRYEDEFKKNGTYVKTVEWIIK